MGQSFRYLAPPVGKLLQSKETVGVLALRASLSKVQDQ